MSVNNNLKVSLIISTYNWPVALDLCLKSIQLQTCRPNEIIVADDGSREETKELIKKYKELFDVPLKHVWHPDEGFKLASIRNKAILASSFDYIIQIDGDLILHPDFIKDHLNLASKNRFVSGSRVLLPKDFSEKMLQSKMLPTLNKLLQYGNNRLNGMRIPFLTFILADLYKRHDPYYVKGCNMAFWREDLIAVNGYNEEITGWGKEDSEIAVRLINKGIERRFIKFGGICFHIYHNEASRNKTVFNHSLLEETISMAKTECKKGINSHFREELIVY